MTTLHQKLAGLTVLGIVSGVSLLAGGIMLGGASADDGGPESTDPKPGLSVVQGEAANVRILSMRADGEDGTCFIAYGGQGDLEPAKAGGVPFGATRVDLPAEAGLMKREVRSAAEGSEAPEFITRTMAAAPISPEEIERRKASGDLKLFAPGDCTMVTPEELEEMVPAHPSRAP